MIKQKYNQHKETAHNFFWRALQIGAKQGTTFLIFFMSAYFLIPEDLGLFSYLMAVVGLLIIFCDFGLSTSTSKYVTEEKTRNSNSLNNILFSISILIIGISAFVSLFIFFVGRFIFEDYNLLIYLIPYLFFLPLSSVADGVYRGLKEFKRLSIISLIVGFFSLIISYLLIKNFGLIGAIISQNILFFLLTFGLIIFREDIKIKFDKIITKKIINYALVVGLANVGFFLYTKIDILILKQFGYIVEIGYYEIINKLFLAISIPTMILGQIIAPNITRLITLGEYDLVRKKIDKTFLPLMIGGILFSILLYFLIPSVVKILLPEYYSLTFIFIFNILLLYLPIKLYANFLVNGFITPGGFAKIITISSLIWGVLNIILDYIFISQYGFIGVFWVTVIVYFLHLLTIGIYFYTKLIRIGKSKHEKR